MKTMRGEHVNSSRWQIEFHRFNNAQATYFAYFMSNFEILVKILKKNSDRLSVLASYACVCAGDDKNPNIIKLHREFNITKVDQTDVNRQLQDLDKISKAVIVCNLKTIAWEEALCKGFADLTI